MSARSPIGESAAEVRSRRVRQSPEYQAEQDRLAPYEDLARMIIRLRMDRALTQEALAARVGTSKTAISRLESGQHAPTAETLRKIARAFGGHLIIGLEMPSSAGSQEPQRTLARVG
jgi:ribosome-binding protein aMBF1 (putative translation factor)